MLKIEQLSRPGNTPVDPPMLKPVNLEIASGEYIVLSGPSGGGKSLLLRVIADLDPNTGEVSLNNEARSRMPAPAWRRRVVYQPAETGWWADDVATHFPDQQAAEGMLPRIGLEDDALNWPVSRLSTGEKQRLGLIRTLLLAPEVMLLDEPTSGLDLSTLLPVETLLRERMDAGVIVVLVTHDSEQTKRLACRRMRMADGELIAARD